MFNYLFISVVLEMSNSEIQWQFPQESKLKTFLKRFYTKFCTVNNNSLLVHIFFGNILLVMENINE